MKLRLLRHLLAACLETRRWKQPSVVSLRMALISEHKKHTFIQGLCKSELLVLNFSIFIWCAFILLLHLTATVASDC